MRKDRDDALDCKRAALHGAPKQLSARPFANGYRPKSGCHAAAGSGAAPPRRAATGRMGRSPVGFSGHMSPDRTCAQPDTSSSKPTQRELFGSCPADSQHRRLATLALVVESLASGASATLNYRHHGEHPTRTKNRGRTGVGSNARTPITPCRNHRPPPDVLSTCC
jgi:hypothetical protein